MKKVALVTGGSRGIGRSIVSILAMENIQVAFTYNSSKELATSLAEKLKNDGYTAIPIKLDMGKKDNIKRSVFEVEEQLGSINILVNNAGISQEKSFEKITDKDFDNMISVNLKGPFFLTQEVVNPMKNQKWGRIINISSIGGQWGGINQVHYAVAKAGLINFTKSLARIYGRYSITSNVITPGLVNTEMVANELSTPEGQAKIDSIPLGRIATTEEIANVVNFLASDKSSYITGQTINVNGGMYFG